MCVCVLCVSEQHYLTELQNLGLVSYTPSREVQGKRISSYDDRYHDSLCHVIKQEVYDGDATYTTDVLQRHHVTFTEQQRPLQPHMGIRSVMETTHCVFDVSRPLPRVHRLMLQLAQKTDGVIVTNDNLRDLSDETPVWRDIIKKRFVVTGLDCVEMSL